MGLKKLLGIISVVIIVVFSMMLTTSYAWYSFGNASTVFEGMTNNDDIIISYQTDEYINTTIAVPILESDIAEYSDKNNFSISVKNNVKDTELAVKISLVDISIDSALRDVDFKFDLYHQDTLIDENGSDGYSNTAVGNTIGNSGATTKTLGTVVLDNDVVNNFELRVYLLDDGTDQSSMENKTFQAKIQIDVVSRLKNTIDDWTGADIYVTSITIDGVASNYIPVDGYYDMEETCTKGSNLEWEPISKTITYTSGSYVNDRCSLAFTTSPNPTYPLLKDMPVGSYVQYVGTNGCSGKACEGQNANYVDDTDMGYCFDVGYKFYVNGWRIGYIEDNDDEDVSNDNAVLISAGAPECVITYVDDHSVSTISGTWSSSYYYGSGYTFDETTGEYTLTGVTTGALAWSRNYQSIIANTPYTCQSTLSTPTCSSQMYKVDASSTSSSVKYYTYYNYEQTYGAPVHLANLDKKALKYCNNDYIKGGTCKVEVAHAMDADDFQKITSSTLSSSSCYGGYSDKICGYSNDLIDNGGYYWFASPYDSASSNNLFFWSPSSRILHRNEPNYLSGVRPVLNLESSVIVVGGKGTYKNPYIIDIVEE